MLAAGRLDARFMTPLVRSDVLGSSIVVALFITALFQQFFRLKARQIQAENQATEAQLRLLQAQIEPHFLFNTLANVISLMEADAPRAKSMLEAFVDYLRASLSGLGHGRHTLGDEIDLIEAYMRIIKIRMEDRLDYRVEVPAALRALTLPALTLQPLVENAIVHGLAPRGGGGTVRVSAHPGAGVTEIVVSDDGVGFTPGGAVRSSGIGIGMDNVDQRLTKLFGPASALRVTSAPGAGTTVAFRVPGAAS